MPEKEYTGIPRLKSSLNIKSKPKTKIQKGTYRRGRTQGKSAALPTSDDPRVLTAAAPTTLSGSASFDLDLSEQQQHSLDSSDLAENVTVADGSVLAPSLDQEERYVAQSAAAPGQRESNPGVRGQGSNDSRAGPLMGNSRSPGRAERTDERQAEGEWDSTEGGVGLQGDWQNPGSSDVRQGGSNSLARRGAGDQAAARVQEPLPEEPQGYSLMWYADYFLSHGTMLPALLGCMLMVTSH